MIDLRGDRAARTALALPVEVDVVFARADDVVETLEGPVRYRSGDPLLTGASGDRWSMDLDRFMQRYDPLDPARMGEDGRYRRRPKIVLARQLDGPLTVLVGAQRSAIRGDAGAWLVQYAPDEHGIVADAIFRRTYALPGDVAE